VLRFGLAYAVAQTVVHHVSLPGGTSIVVASVTTLFASYLTASGRAVWAAGHPSIDHRPNGAQAKRAADPTHGDRCGPTSPTAYSETPHGRERGPREYLYDVALESVQLVPVAVRELDPPRDEDGNVLHERNPVKIAIRDVSPANPNQPKLALSDARNTVLESTGIASPTTLLCAQVVSDHWCGFVESTEQTVQN
jgi:hypothetical protein